MPFELKNPAPTSFDDILEQWPNLADFARDMEAPYQRVYRWHTRAVIPLRYWPRLQDLLRQRGRPMTFEQLYALLPAPITVAGSPPSDR